MANPPEPMPGDDKDWTWVLEQTCGECGFVASSFQREAVSAMIRDNAEAFSEIMNRNDPIIRRRPNEQTWSPLEYGCHVRDVYVLYLERLDLMLTMEGPRYPNWDQDETAVSSRYDLADPLTVGDEIVSAAEALAVRFDSVSGDQWQRTGYRSDGAAFTVESFARYLIHDPIHHLHDVSS